MAKRRPSHLLLSLASGALASAALLPGCSGTDTSATPSSGGTGGSSGGAAGATACSAAHPCGLVVNPNGGSAGTFGLVMMPPSAGAGGTTIVTGLVIQPGEAGATGEAGAGQGGTGPCGGHVCGSVVAPGGSGGTAGAKP